MSLKQGIQRDDRTGAADPARRAEPEANSSAALLSRYEPLVRRIAKRVYSDVSKALDVEDLIQIGIIALIEAARRYEDRGFQFSSYASVRIRGDMIDQLRREATLSPKRRRARRHIDEITRTLATRSGGTPSEAAIAGAMGIGPGAYRVLADATAGATVASLEDIDACQFLDVADPEPLADEVFDSSRKAATLSAHVAGLPLQDQIVLQLFFVEDQPLEAIGDILGVSASRICQIKKVALAKLSPLMRRYQ